MERKTKLLYSSSMKEELYSRFKDYCSSNNETPSQVLREYVLQCIEEMNEEKGSADE